MPLGRRPDAAYRKREHLTETEIDKLIEAAKGNRYGQRDATMILVAYRHGLRASEICELSWDAIDFNAATIHVTGKKHGLPATRQIRGDELRALRKLHKEQEPKSAFVFTSERGGAPFTRDSFNWMVKRAGKKARLPFQVHAHMIRHATGYKLANAGKDTRSIPGYSKARTSPFGPSVWTGRALQADGVRFRPKATVRRRTAMYRSGQKRTHAVQQDSVIPIAPAVRCEAICVAQTFGPRGEIIKSRRSGRVRMWATGLARRIDGSRVHPARLDLWTDDCLALRGKPAPLDHFA